MWLTTDELNFVAAMASVDLNANTTGFPCRTVNLGRYDSMVAVINVGAGSTYRVWVNAASTVTGISSGSTGTLVPFTYRVSGSAANASTSDTLGARSSTVTTTGTISTSGYSHDGTTSPNVSIYVEVKSADLPQGYNYCAVSISTAAQAHPASVNYVMKPRYPQLNQVIAGS